MTQPYTAATTPMPATEPDLLELLMQDREWVEAEFQAILKASGLGDPLAIGTVRRPPRRFASTGPRHQTRPGEHARWLRTTPTESRVRSPPEP